MWWQSLDAQEVINAIHTVSPNSAFGLIVDNIKEAVQDSLNVGFAIVRRSSHGVTHALVRGAIARSNLGEWHSCPPSFLVSHLYFDLNH